MSPLPVVGGGTALGLAMGGGRGGRGGAGGRGVLVGAVGDGARSYPRQGQTAGRTGLACPILLAGTTDTGGEIEEVVSVSAADLLELSAWCFCRSVSVLILLFSALTTDMKSKSVLQLCLCLLVLEAYPYISKQYITATTTTFSGSNLYLKQH